MRNFYLWFFLKNTDCTCTFIWYFGVVVKLIFGSSLHLYEEKEECFFFAFLKSWFFEGDYALRHESKYGLLLHTISGGVQQQQQSFASSWKLQKKNLVGKDSHLHQLRTTFFGHAMSALNSARPPDIPAVEYEDMNSFKATLTHMNLELRKRKSGKKCNNNKISNQNSGIFIDRKA